MRPGTLLRWHALKNILKSEIKNNFTILDIGGYDGYIARNFKKQFSNLKITVVDLDKSGLQLAKKQGLSILHSSALELPIKNNQIDVVLCLDLVEHVKNDSGLIREISRVLKKNGKIILSTPMKNGVCFPFLSKKKNEAINKNWGHVRKGYSLEQIKNLFRDNNLSVIKTNRYFNLLTRIIYSLIFLSGIPIKGKCLLFRTITWIEPYVKIGAQEYIIIGKKLK